MVGDYLATSRWLLEEKNVYFDECLLEFIGYFWVKSFEKRALDQKCPCVALVPFRLL